MPPKVHDNASESSDDNAQGGHFDPSRFTNPNYSREFIAALPPRIRARTQALLGLDAEYMTAKKAHDERVSALKKAFEKETALPMAARRKQLVMEGAADAELVVAGVNAEKDEDVKKVDLDAPAVPLAGASAPAPTPAGLPGLPGFWLKALRRHVIVQDMITERDAEVLQTLVDISTATLDAPATGFLLRFEFDGDRSAQFFSERVLSKTFHLKEVFDELVVERTEASGITWVSDEKNTTVKTVTKKQRSKGPKAKVRYVTKTEPCDSFFNFFKKAGDAAHDGEQDEEHDGGASDEEEEQWLGLAHVLKDKIVPFAVEYFTAEAADGSSDLDEDEDLEGEEEEEEEDENEEPPVPIRAGGRGGQAPPQQQPAPKRAGGAPAPKPAGKAADCKQQ